MEPSATLVELWGAIDRATFATPLQEHFTIPIAQWVLVCTSCPKHAGIVALALVAFLAISTHGIGLIAVVVLGVFAWQRYKSSKYAVQLRGRKGSLLGAYQSFKESKDVVTEEDRPDLHQERSPRNGAASGPIRRPSAKANESQQRRTVVRLSCQHLEDMIGDPLDLVGRRMLCRTCGVQRVEAVLS